MASQYGRVGCRRVTVLLKRYGWSVNHKRVARIWRREGVRVPQKQLKRGRLWLNDGPCGRLRPEHPYHVWGETWCAIESSTMASDFVLDHTRDGRKIRMLTVIDEFARECLVINVARRLNSHSVLAVLAGLVAKPDAASQVIADWASPFQRALETLVAAFDPQLIVVGGGLGDDMVSALHLVETESAWFDMTVEPAKLGDNAGVIGAGVRGFASVEP